LSLIRLQNISMSFESNVILRDVFFQLSRGDRVGLIGKNGSGKTTLLKLILGQEEPTAGTVAIDQGLEIGYFSQFSELSGDSTVLDVLHEVDAPIHDVEQALAEVGAAIEEGPTGKELDRLLHHQASLFEEMERLDGWDCALRMETVLTKLGFNDVHRARPIDQLSGGWRNRAALAKILLEGPSVLLMDEPTNFLDLAGLTWLEGWFNKLPGALIVVSHDRHFLDQVATRVVEVENHRLQEYEGGFSEYVLEKQRRFKTLEHQFEHEEALLAHEALAIEKRQRAGNRALKRRMANIKKRKVPRPVDKIITGIYQGLSVPNVLCSVENVSKVYDEQTVLRDVSFELRRRDRLAVIGPNGCGKTTLLRVLTGGEKRESGTIKWGVRNSVEFAFYNEMLEELDLNDTVTHAVNVFRMALNAPRKVVNRFLSLMQFSDMDLKQRIGTLSGGERARVALTKCLLSGAPVIFLDEPTNHLDVTSTQVMERALVHFPGSVVVVSHDRFFIDKVATRLLVFGPGGETRTVNGNWTQWQGRRAAT
jgi:ATPase subunit of ABC transporter with duplicated ATPase domains